MRLSELLLAGLLSTSALAQNAPPDPMRPPTQAEVEAWFGRGTTTAERAPFDLQAILLGPGRRIAIVDGTRLRVGESIGNATVESIEPGRVVLSRAGQRIELNIDTHLTNHQHESRD